MAHEVRALDSLHGQVHDRREPPAYLDKDIELLVADVREPDAVRRALRGISFVVHLAARVGVAQSMEQIGDYTSVNSLGTAVLLDALRDKPVEKLVVASSMSVYGEGRYLDKAGSPVPARRTREQLERGEWEPVGPHGERLHGAPTSEDKKPAPASFYALGKLDQERMCLLFGEAYDVATVALRFFNVYGPYQALSNPYTGVLAIFAARLLSGRPPLLYEDGGQRRDFVSVRDAARACRLALERPQAADRALNIGSGNSMTVRDVAVRLGALLRPRHRPGGARRLPDRRRPPLLRRRFARGRLARLRAAGDVRRGNGRARRVAGAPPPKAGPAGRTRRRRHEVPGRPGRLVGQVGDRGRRGTRPRTRCASA